MNLMNNINVLELHAQGIHPVVGYNTLNLERNFFSIIELILQWVISRRRK